MKEHVMQSAIAGTYATQFNPTRPILARRPLWETIQKRPSAEAFERFGIDGGCQLLSRDGVLSLRDLTVQDDLISRSGGFVRPVAILSHPQTSTDGMSPRSASILANALGGGLPQGDIALGIKNPVSRFIASGGTAQPSLITLDPEDNLGTLRVQQHDDSELFILIFVEKTEVLIEGIYINCPTIADLNSLYAKPKS